jgi:hypothetical protein
MKAEHALQEANKMEANKIGPNSQKLDTIKYEW